MTINGLKNTVRYDEEVFRWAIAFLQVDSIPKALPKNKICTFKVLHCLVMAINFGAAFFVLKLLMSSPGPVDFLLILAIVVGVYLFELPYKNLTASLVTEFMEAKFPPQELQNRTLLQLGLQLEREFGVNSIVDMAGIWTKVFRAVFLAAFIVITKFSLFLWGAWILRAISRSTRLTSFFKAFS